MSVRKRTFLCISSCLILSLCLAPAGCNDKKTSVITSSSNSSNNTLQLPYVRGTVTNATTAAALDEYVTITFDGTTAPRVIAKTASDGTYSAELSADTYSVSATRPGYTSYSLASLVVSDSQAVIHNFDMAPLAANTYIKSTNCAVCHQTKYDTFINSGHPYKLNKVTNATRPEYPFSSIAGALGLLADADTGSVDVWTGTDNTLGTPATYADVSYVIGGYGWKARFLDANGYIVTGSAVQFNLKTQGMVSYHENDNDKKYNCGNCHTTGWKHYDSSLNNNRQDNLPGMDGTFSEGGVHCEACHGAGSKHAQTKSESDITKIATPLTTVQMLDPDMAYGKPRACADCHTRDGGKDYPTYVSAYADTVIAAGAPSDTVIVGGRIDVSGGLIRHHQQYDEVLGVDPDNVRGGSSRTNVNSVMWDCITCHRPHNTTVYEDHADNHDEPGEKGQANCLICHPTKDPTLNVSGMGMRLLKCVDCHMPLLIKSATSESAVGTGPITGDIKSHIFRISMATADSSQFTTDGKYAYPRLSKEFACLKCHNGVDAPDRSSIDDSGFKFH